MNVRDGKEWSITEGINISEEYFKKHLSNNIFYKNANTRYFHDQDIKINKIKTSFKSYTSTQAFGQILNDIGKQKDNNFKRIITTSPDVTVSTSLGGWVNQETF